MNIIQLFTTLELNRSQILEFAVNDFIRIEKKINFEKKTNPEIDANVAESLVLALEEYPQELFFVLSNRVLFNFFTHNNLSKNHFAIDNSTISEEKIRNFIGTFLSDELIAFFSFKLSTNTYENLEELDYLLDLKIFFPEETIYKMGSLVFSKLDFAISQLSILELNDFSNIIYIRFRSFYDLISHFRTVETDHKISKLLSLVIRFYIKKSNVEFFTSVIQSMAFYTAFDESINETLIKNRAAVSVFSVDVSQSKSTFSVGGFIGLVCALIPFLVSKCS
jgi:hypothetical protein